MKKNVLRVLACLLCALLVLPVVPANAAENTAAQPRDLTQNDYGDYWFTTLEELKTLAGMTFDRQTWAYYVGEDALVISEDLTLPENLIVHGYEKSVRIPQNVTVSMYSLRMRHIVVDGTLTVTSGMTVFREGSLEINGKLIMAGISLELQIRTPIRGEENIVYENGAAMVHQYLYVTDAQDFMAVVGMAYSATKPRYDYGVVVEAGTVELTSDVTLPANLVLITWNGGELVVGSGCALTLQSGANIGGRMLVKGHLVNNSEVYLSSENSILQFDEQSGSYSGSGILHGYMGKANNLSYVVPGLDLEQCVVQRYPESGYFAIRWAEDMFTDVAKDAFYFAPVQWAVKHGITTGTSAEAFSPDAACTRGQVVTFLWRAAGCPEPSSLYNPFGDVTGADYYYKAVLWAVEKGITNGLSATAFGPNEVCNRGQVATFLHRYANRPSHSNRNPFTDVNQQDYFYNPVLWAVESGITNGMGDGIFAPGATCTRGQIVTFLFRAIGE